MSYKNPISRKDPNAIEKLNLKLDELCRLQLVFDEKPTEEQIYLLKLNGFKWSPNNRAWQRQLNQSAISAADRLGFVNPVEGVRASALQPKIEVKDKGGEAR